MAQQNNFIVDLITSLKKAQSKKQIKSDIKTLGDIKIPLIGKLDKPKTIKQVKNDVKSLGDIFVPLIGKLHKSKTKAQLKQDTASLNSTVSLTGTVNQKSTNASVQQATKQAQAVANKNKIKLDASFNIKKSKLLADIQYFAQQNSKMMKDANMASKYNTLLDNAKLATSNKEIRSLRMQLSAMRSELRANNLAGLTLGDTLKKTFKRAMELFSGTGFVMLWSQQLRQAWRESLNLDQAFTNLVKVQSALTRGDYPEYLERCTRKAKELATTQQALIEGATEFSKSGYDLTTSNKLTEQSTILSNVGDMSASDSAKALISGVQAYDTISGYDDVIDKAKVLIDLYNELGNTSAITTKEIAESVQTVGSVFADSNTSVQEFVSLLSAGNRQFQDADSMALALRTAALRIRGAKVELEQMGEETDGVYTSVSKLQEKIYDLTNIDGKGGVQILEADQKTYRSIYEIFVDLSKVYQQMSDVDQSALLNLISGVHRSSAISAVLNNMAEAQEIYQRSLESAGSAQEEYDKYLESSIASLNNFKANMIETYQAVFNGETTKAILDTGSSVLEFANSLGLVESTLKGFIAIGVLKALTTLSTAFKASALQASNFGKALQFANSIPNDPNSNLAKRFSSLKNIAIASKSLNEAQLKLVLSNKALSNEDRIRVLRLMGLEKSVAKVKLEEMGLAQATNAQSTAQKAATINTFSFSAAVKGLGNSLRLAFISNPVGISIMALSTIIGAVSAKISEYKENIRETRQANMDAATSAKEEADSLNELYIQYSKLSSITDKTSQQEDDFKQVVQDITKALGNKADALEGVTAGTDEYAKSLREATKAELESQYATAKVGAKAAEEALKDKTYSGWDGSQITIAKNEQMTRIEEHVAALEAVQDILAKYEDMSSNGMEWEPIGWDEDRNDMNAVLEYYYDLIEARDRLATDENADFLMSSDIYKNINTTINSLSESVKNYTEQQYQALLLQYEWQNGIPRTEEEFKAMEESILSASGAGEEFQKILKDFLINDFASFFPEDTDTEIAKTEQSAKKLFDQLTTSKESIDKFTSSVESAYDSYAKLMNPNVSSSDILSSIQSITSAVSDMDGALDWEFIGEWDDALDILGNAIEDILREYAESVLSGAGIDVDSKFGQMLANNIIQAQKASIELDNLNDGLDSLQSAYSSLTDIVEAYNETGYLTFDQLQTLLELEPQYLACLIDENGQLQLNEQAMSALANQRLDDAEAQAVQQAITELGQLALQDQQKAVEDNATAFTNAIDDLVGYNQELANTIAEATVGASAIRDLNAAISGAQSQGATDDQINTVLSNLETKLKLISDVRNKVQSGGLGAVANPTTTKSKSSKDTTESIDWIARAIENLESEISRLDKVINSTFISFSEKNEAIAEQIGLVNKEIELQQKAYEAYMAKADSINLSDKYKELVQNGTISIEDITDKDLQSAISDYQKWYDEAKETQDKINDLYEQSSELHVDNYNLEAEELGKYRDKHLIDMAKYYQSMMDLQDKYYNSEALKLKELADKMEVEYGRMSSINLTRPSVDASAMQSAGYNTELQSSSVYAQSFGNEEKQVVVTPILPNGTILSPEALADYANKLLNGEKIDANIELAMFEGKDAVKQTVEYINGLESMQSEYQKLKSTLSQNPYGDFTEEQIKAIEELSEELDNVMNQLSGELGDIKSAYDDLIEIRDTYNEYGKISVDQYQSLCDMGFQYLALLSDESGALSLDEEAFQRLADAKIQEMQVTMALQAVDLINSIQTEEQAIQYLAASYGNLANQALNAAEAMLYAAQSKMALEYGSDSLQAQAANTIVKGYENSKLLSGVVD